MEPDSDRIGTGQILAEKVAGGIGSWRFIGAQAGVMVVWVLINTLAFFHAIQYDAYPFVFLNLAMSAEAAFAAPVLLIAANVGATRDHAQANRIEKLGAQNEQMAEQNEKLNEQNEKLVAQMRDLEEMVDQHITASAKAHSAEIADLTELVRSIHTTVSSLAPNGSASVPTAPSTSGGAAVRTPPTVAPRSPAKRGRDNSANSRS